MASLLKEKQLSYWSQLLSQNQSLKLPTDYPRVMLNDETSTSSSASTPLVEYKPLEYTISMEQVLNSSKFRELFIKNGDSDAQQLFTKNSFILSLFVVLLCRYTYEETFLIGVLQDINEEKDSFILSANIPMPSNEDDTFEGISQSDATEKYSFNKLLSSIQQSYNDSLNHLSYFNNVKNILDQFLSNNSNSGSIDTNLLVQVSYSSFAGPFTKLDKPFPISNVDLNLHYNTQNNELSIIYQNNLFTDMRMSELLNQLKSVSEQVLSSNCNVSIYDISLVTEYAKKVLPHPDLPLNNDFIGPIHEIFQEQAKKTPDRITMVDNNESVTFEQLNRISNQLSRHLLHKGLKRQEVVTVFGHRSCPVVLAILSTLKCGAVFNMLDPAYPADRIITCLEVSTPSAVILIEAAGQLPKSVVDFINEKTKFVTVLKSMTDILNENVYSDYDDSNLSQDPTLNVKITQDDFAVCTYTSGSTGIPKGVLGRHGPLTHYYPWMKQYFGFGENDRFSMQSGISHDPLQRDIFTPWFLGCTMYIPSNEDIVNPGRLAEWFEEKQITVCCLTPPMGQLLATAASVINTSSQLFQLTHLRYAFFVGDVLSKKFVKRLCDIAPIVKVINLYGSTETQRSVTYYMVPRPGEKCIETGIPFEQLKDILPIGRGMQDVQALTLSRFTSRDNKFMLSGIGEMGEIYMRSPHLSQGYKGKEKDTREKFIPNPFMTSGYIDRMYRTGDLGRYLISGDAECSGRADDQIKIRGFRIELGEINTCLNSHEFVKESVTIVREDCIQGEKRIVTYFVLDKVELEKNSSINAKNGNYMESSIIKTIIKDLRQHIRTRLPDYMIPSYFVPLEKIPLTPNGKIKKQDLPNPIHMASLDSGDEEGYVAPRNDLEKQLQQIWADVLSRGNTDNIGIHDNFFDLGGHSINATTLTLLIRNQVEGAQKLPVELLFRAPTISALAVAIEQLRSGQTRNQHLIQDVSMDCHLEASIRPQHQLNFNDFISYSKVWQNPKQMLITGCTGFLGTFLLADLLKKSTAKLYCVVRAENEEKARKRILESLLSYHFLWTSKEMDQEDELDSVNSINRNNLAQIVDTRIIPVLGDLTKPLLGLNENKFEEMSNIIDVIVHNGAAVHWLYSYDKLKASNVNGTREILKMACAGKKLTPVHYVSTTSVFDSDQYKEFTDVYEDSTLPYHEDLTGYPQSKYVAEKLCMNARMRGLPVCIYRPGYITGHAKTGVWNPDDFLCRMIKGCIQMGYYPDMPLSKLDMSPVDFISGAIVHLSRTMECVVKHQAYHLVNPHEFFFNSLFECGNKLGYTIKPLPFKEWKEKLYQATVHRDVNAVSESGKAQEENVLYPLVTYFTDDYDLKMTAKRPWYDNTHTLEGLENSNVTCPKVIELMTTYYCFLCKCGFLHPPQNPTDLAKKFGFHKIPQNLERDPKAALPLDLSLVSLHSDVNNTESPSPTSFNYQSLMRNNRI